MIFTGRRVKTPPPARAFSFTAHCDFTAEPAPQDHAMCCLTPHKKVQIIPRFMLAVMAGPRHNSR